MKLSFIGKKIGMTQVPYNGIVVPVTLIQVGTHDIMSVKTFAKHGYDAICISAGDVKTPKNISKPIMAQYTKAEISPRTDIYEARLASPLNLKQKSFAISSDIIGTFVDISAITVGKGFTGAMKRWNFRGLEASHGVSVSHRSHGSTGNRQDPGRVFKGKKMAGHKGVKQRTMQNLEVIMFDEELSIVAVKGSFPGVKGSTIFMKESVKRSSGFTNKILDKLSSDV